MSDVSTPGNGAQPNAPEVNAANPFLIRNDADYLKVLSRLASSTWASILVLGALAGYLLSLLVDSGVAIEIRPVLALGLKANLAIFAVVVFGPMAAALCATCAACLSGNPTKRDYFACAIAGAAAFFCVLIVMVSLWEAACSIHQLWGKLGVLAQ